MITALEKAIYVLGSQAEIAKRLDITPGAVSQWFNGHCPVPAMRCIQFEMATSGAVSCEDLRPDVRWVRVKDKTWPHPQGRPLVDHAKKAA